MQLKYLTVVLFITILNVCNSTRRIVSGKLVSKPKKYMVYLLKAEIDPKAYDAWLCGGAIVSPYFIITSAACVLDVEHMYAIAGYDKYVPNEQIDNDACIAKTKRKIVYTCVPKYYELDYERIDRWSQIDIALVKVETPYIMNDPDFSVCSYVPEPIIINYENKYQEIGTDAMVLGWGHQEIWRKANDTKNYNTKSLHYASTMVENKEKCKQQYEDYANMSYIIDNYMICCHNVGNVDEKGDILSPGFRNATGCLSSDPHKRLRFGDNCVVNRKNLTKLGLKLNFSNMPGICQNDHGGPLVTWVGTHEVLIGIASVFKVDSDYRCKGPYLYTSTQCNGAFLSCILDNAEAEEQTEVYPIQVKQEEVEAKNVEKNDEVQEDSEEEYDRRLRLRNKFRRDECNNPQLRGYDTIEKYTSWTNHPDGVVNEKLTRRSGANVAPGCHLTRLACRRVVDYAPISPRHKFHLDSEHK